MPLLGTAAADGIGVLPQGCCLFKFRLCCRHLRSSRAGRDRALEEAARGLAASGASAPMAGPLFFLDAKEATSYMPAGAGQPLQFQNSSACNWL